MPAMKTYREAIFSGWFGPMGVGAVFLSIIAKEELETAYEGKESPVSIKVIRPVVLFIVFCSVLVHGTTIPLFKLGKRIRTRTLSITSISSNQVLRLPKLQFGQQLSKKNDHRDHHNYHKKEEDIHTMTELERNTLFNTLQHSKEDQTTFTTVDMSNKHDSDSDLAEEDFLPDDSSDTLNTLHPPPRLDIPESAFLDDDNNDIRRGSTTSVDTQQAIRFLEPVIPRTPIGTTQDKHDSSSHHSSSLKNWLLPPKQQSSTTTLSDESDIDQHGHGIKQLFKRRKDTAESSSNSRKSSIVFNTDSNHTETSLNSRIEIWEEPNHVVIEDKKGHTKEIVIDKADNPNWKQETRKKVKQVENKIKTGDES